MTPSDNLISALTLRCDQLEADKAEMLDKLRELALNGEFYITAIESRNGWHGKDFKDYGDEIIYIIKKHDPTFEVSP